MKNTKVDFNALHNIPSLMKISTEEFFPEMEKNIEFFKNLRKIPPLEMDYKEFLNTRAVTAWRMFIGSHPATPEERKALIPFAAFINANGVMGGVLDELSHKGVQSLSGSFFILKRLHHDGASVKFSLVNRHGDELYSRMEWFPAKAHSLYEDFEGTPSEYEEAFVAAISSLVGVIPIWTETSVTWKIP